MSERPKDITDERVLNLYMKICELRHYACYDFYFKGESPYGDSLLKIASEMLDNLDLIYKHPDYHFCIICGHQSQRKRVSTAWCDRICCSCDCPNCPYNGPSENDNLNS